MTREAGKEKEKIKKKQSERKNFPVILCREETSETKCWADLKKTDYKSEKEL
jgi:hypothetical protein